MVHRGVRERLTFVPLALVTWAILLAAYCQPCHAENPAAIKEFGVEISKPINARYGDRPNTVRRVICLRHCRTNQFHMRPLKQPESS